MEAYSDNSMNTHYIDPLHYMGIPSYTFDCMKMFSKVKLEYIKQDHIEFWESMKRGGVSMIAKRFAKANHPYVPDYDPSKPITYILYVDATNLYGWAMMQLLPMCGFEWLETIPEETDPEKLAEFVIHYQDMEL
jgi:hypothetical protein